MKALNRLDIAIAIVFGCFIFIVVSFFQKHSQLESQIHLSSITNLKQQRNGYAKDVENSRQHNQTHRSSRLLKMREAYPHSNVKFDSQGQTSDSVGYDFYAEALLPESSQSVETGTNSNLGSIEYERQRIEDYIVNYLGFSVNESDRVLNAKSHFESQIIHINQLGVTRGNNEDTQSLSQKAKSEYQDELMQILGHEDYQKFVQWNNQLEAEIAEMRAGGRVASPTMGDAQFNLDSSID